MTEKGTSRRVWILALAGLFLAGLALRVGYIASHCDLDWEPDAYQHVLVARSAISHGAAGLWALVDVWAKPLYTAVAALLFALLPRAWPGLVVMQAVSCIAWLGAVALIADLARRELGRGPALLAVVVGLFGNVAFRSSVSALTEPLGALTVAAALWCFSRRRFGWSFLCIGLAPLARIDAVALVAVQLCFYAWKRERRLARLLLAGLLALGPLVVWDLLGALHTGNLFFLAGQYPVNSAAIYGTGGWLYYPREIWRFDPVFLACALAAFAAAFPWIVTGTGTGTGTGKESGTARLAGLQGALHLSLLAFFWKRGMFGSAGLLRYFMLVEPALILSGAWVFSRLALVVQRRRLLLLQESAFTVVMIALGLGLVPLYRSPQDIHNQLTSLEPSTLGSFPYRRLAALRTEWPSTAVHADRPEALYYLGADHGIYDEGGLSAARDGSVAGLFVYSPHWSDAMSGADPRAWPGMRLVETIPPGIEVFARP